MTLVSLSKARKAKARAAAQEAAAENRAKHGRSKVRKAADAAAKAKLARTLDGAKRDP